MTFQYKLMFSWSFALVAMLNIDNKGNIYETIIYDNSIRVATLLGIFNECS